jgi:hypothetical protein
LHLPQRFRVGDATAGFRQLQAHCIDDVKQLPSSEFLDRQRALGELLAKDEALYISEPGANSAYFANISSNDWHLSERPFLVIISPLAASDHVTHQVSTQSSIDPQVSILTPNFEYKRATTLRIPSSLPITYIAWEEDANPFDVAARELVSKLPKKIYVDDRVRAFVLAGLEEAFPDAKVQIAPPAVTSFREKKSSAEVDILRCANEVSVMNDSTKLFRNLFLL